MPVLMVKKQFANGETCQKCAQAEELLRRRGLFEQVEVVWAIEGDPESPGMRLAKELGIELAPFFVVERAGVRRSYTSVLKFIAEELLPTQSEKKLEGDTLQKLEGEDVSPSAGSPVDVASLVHEAAGKSPLHVVELALKTFGADCVLAFSGAEDVALIDMAVKSGHPFRVFTLDTGRLHPETYRFIDRVREHFGIEIEIAFPNALEVEGLVKKKGLFSFYADGHGECCKIRKVQPLVRLLAGYRAWMTGQRRDQSPTRTEVAVVELDATHTGRTGPLVKWNPLAEWSLSEVWQYIRDNDLPYNPLHDQGFISIGCEPCTRAVRPGEHERAGRWWWEDSTKRECGLHLKS